MKCICICIQKEPYPTVVCMYVVCSHGVLFYLYLRFFSTFYSDTFLRKINMHENIDQTVSNAKRLSKS